MTNINDALKNALLKRAAGHTYEEVTEEYAPEGAEAGLKLVKRKIVTKYSPPDPAAARALLGLEGGGIAQMSDEELRAEEERILAALKKEIKDEFTARG